MEDVLAVYTRPRDGDCPLVCLDETSKQLIAETRVPIPMKAGRPARFDYEYERNGTANLFMMLDQKIASMSAELAWWLDTLQRGELPGESDGLDTCLAYWYTDSSYANPDAEVLNAVEPGL